jgi:cysteine synthase A
MTANTPEKMNKELAGKFNHLWGMVGNTPMIEVCYKYKGDKRFLYVKCEYFNLTGSIKDRMALYILQKAYEQGLIKKGAHIIEATSGNTGISFSAIGKALGNTVTIIMPDWLSKERKDIIKSLGAEIILVSKEQGGFKGCIQLSEEMAAKDSNVFLPKQFENQYNCEAHEHTTAKEIWAQLKNYDLEPDAFVAGVGTGGTIMGANNFFKKMNPSITVHPVEPEESPTLTTGYKTGSHRIQGISDEFIPAIVELNKLDEIIPVSDGDAIIMAQKLGTALGLGVGISSGANIIAAMKVQNEYNKKYVVTVFPDSNKKYLSTDLMKTETIKPKYLSGKVELSGYRVMMRMN